MVILGLLVTIFGFLILSYISYIHYRINKIEDSFIEYRTNQLQASMNSYIKSIKQNAKENKEVK